MLRRISYNISNVLLQKLLKIKSPNLLNALSVSIAMKRLLLKFIEFGLLLNFKANTSLNHFGYIELKITYQKQKTFI